MDKIYYTVYKVTNKINGKVYIGIHKTRDLDDGYMGSGTYLSHAIKKYGIENFEKEVLYIFDTPEEMYSMEAEIVNEDFLAEENTYNLKVGGFGGWDYVNILGRNRNSPGNPDTLLSSSEVKKKLIEEGRWNAYTEGQSKKLKELYSSGKRLPSFKGKKHTKETKEKLKNHSRQNGEKNSQYGTCWIHNLDLKENKKISKNDIQSYLNKGWLKGRKMKF